MRPFRGREATDVWTNETKLRRRLPALVVGVALCAVVAACTGGVADSEVSEGSPQVETPAASSSDSLPRPATDFCRAAQASLGRIALDELPGTVEEARLFYEDAWGSMARTATTQDIQVSANEVLHVKDLTTITTEVRTRVEARMITVYRAVSQECPDLAEPVKIYLVRMLTTVSTRASVVIEIWRSILELQPLPELDPPPPETSPEVTTPLPPTTAAANVSDDERLCQALLALENEDMASPYDPAQSLEATYTEYLEMVERYFPDLDRIPPSPIQQEVAEYVASVRAREEFVEIFDKATGAARACDKATVKRTWPYDTAGD